MTTPPPAPVPPPFGPDDELMRQHVDRVLIHRDDIARRVHDLAHQIADDYRAHLQPSPQAPPPQLTLVPILTGSLIFASDLVRRLPLMMRLRMITVSSYPGRATQSQGAKIEGRLPEDLSGQHVLIVDDILDSGQTITLVQAELDRRNAASVRTCALLRKQLPTAMAVRAEYVGFDIPDAFVVGYGLDYDGYYRNLPDVVTLKPQVFHPTPPDGAAEGNPP